MESKSKNALKTRILRLLSVDARISMQDLANGLGTTKVNAYNMFNETAQEYALNFAPEIRIDRLWKWEFIKRARLMTKRGILAEAVEELPLTGFSEYLVFVKFIGKEPKDEEIAKALGTSYIPQFVAKTKGKYSLMIYAVARSYEDAMQFADSLNKSLSKYEMLTHTTRIWSNFGFFPLSKKLITEFDIFDTYKNLLFGLSDAGRNTFTEIGKRFNQGPAQMLYAYDRLVRTEILKRVTYFEKKPKGGINLVVLLKSKNAKIFEETRSKWFMRLIKDYDKRENECVFMCDVPDPKGMLVIANVPDKKSAAKFISCIKSSVKEIEIESMQISKIMLGNLGIRDFNMRYTPQYKSLERRGLAPSIREKQVELVVENPNAI